MQRVKYYSKIWWLLAKNSFVVILSKKTSSIFFLTGKLLRFAFFAVFLYFLATGTKGISGYNSNQILLFFLTFNLIDVLGQFFFRAVYSFRQKIISGDFDLVLIKPP